MITGITGQDGAYLAAYLLSLGYHVFGGVRRTSSPNLWRLSELEILEKVDLVSFDVCDNANVYSVINGIRPDELYNLAAQSFVSTSFDQPTYTSDVNGFGFSRIIEAVRLTSPETRVYQASTSEMFGNSTESPQDEFTPFRPRSPYGVSKLYAHCLATNYREAYGLHISSGILFNHESPLRGQEFVTRKITIGLAEIKHGLRDTLRIGNLEAKRDWGFAGDYVDGMWRMLQQPRGGDFVLATGKTHSVRKFIECACESVGMSVTWSGSGLEEIGEVKSADRKGLIIVDPKLFRPTEVDVLIGNPSRAARELGWVANTKLDKLARMMLEADLKRCGNSHLASSDLNFTRLSS